MKKIGIDLVFNKTNILVPKEKIDMNKWAIIACDQYTSNIKYWDDLKDMIGDAPSTINLIYPEAYILYKNNNLLNSIHKNMKNYLNKNIFNEYKSSLVYVLRETSNGQLRAGIVGQIDLEKYEPNINKFSLIKPTEKIDTNRLNIREKIRKDALLDISHIILFYQDKYNRINKKLKKSLIYPPIYNFKTLDSNQKLSGFLIDQNISDEILCELNKKLINYRSPLIVADGNHSLLVAKNIYEEYKKHNDDYLFSPLRYALVEIENLYDKNVEIKSINRLIYNIDIKMFISELKQFINKIPFKNKYKFDIIEIYSHDMNFKIDIPQLNNITSVELIQSFIDDYLTNNVGSQDYIHEREKVLDLVRKDDKSVGILFNSIKKNIISKRINEFHIFDKKTFSVGRGSDKRYYLETRELFK